MIPETRATYQLSLLGDEPKRGKEWVPKFWQPTLMGLALSPGEDALRQCRMLSRETLPGAFDPPASLPVSGETRE